MDRVVYSRDAYTLRSGDGISQGFLNESLDYLSSSLPSGYLCYESHSFALSRVEVLLETEWLKLVSSTWEDVTERFCLLGPCGPSSSKAGWYWTVWLGKFLWQLSGCWDLWLEGATRGIPARLAVKRPQYSRCLPLSLSSGPCKRSQKTGQFPISNW